MIVPTARAVLLALLGLPVALTLAAALPAAWTLGLLWPLGVLTLLTADALLARWPWRVAVTPTLPGGMEVGREAAALFHVKNCVEKMGTSLGVTPPLVAGEGTWSGDTLRVPLGAPRRGTGAIDALWLRWRGPLGLASWQKRTRLGHAVRVAPDTTAVQEHAIRFASRFTLGETAQRRRGEGSELEALREFQPGMDSRAIDWKHTARHRTLLAREFRTERNQNVVLAIDAGRLMSEPIAPGEPSRLDVAVTAALLVAYGALRRGDRTALFAYDAAPQLSTGLVAGARAWPALKRAASEIDYSTRETNHTYGLSALAGKLDRRSLVVVLTEFADTTAAELMIETVGRLTRDHLVLFVALRDDALEALRAEEPGSLADISRAVVAADLLAERQLVLTRLRRAGADVLEAEARQLGPALLARSIEVRERGLL